MVEFYVKSNTTTIPLGRQGENLARTIYFELSEMIEEYGAGTATLICLRNKDSAPYVCDTTQSGSILSWTPTDTDTAYAGAGKCELRWSVGEVLAKSIVYNTVIAPSISGDSVVPSEYESWYEALLEHISKYEIASDQIEANAENIATNTNDIAVLDGRVDVLTTLPEGSTTGDAELADIRVGADGTVYENAGDAVRQQVNDLHVELSFIATVEKNLLNPENVLDGYYYKYVVDANGKYIPSPFESADYVCSYIDVTNGAKYITSRLDFNAYNVNADGQITGYASQGNGLAKVLDTTGRGGGWGATGDTARVYFSWKKTLTPVNAFMVVRGEALPSEYVPYGANVTLNEDIQIPETQITKSTYYVNPDGTGDFTTLMGAFVALKDDETPKTIYVASGTYNIYEEIGGDDFVNSIPSSGASYWDYITIVPKNTKVIGIGGVTLEYLPESVPDVSATFIAPINVSDGDVEIENIKIVCTNCRYGIHDQTREDHPKGYRHVYKNVTIYKDSSAGYTGFRQALGGGLTQGAEIVVENCIFQSYMTPFSYHNAGGGYANIILKNSAFDNLRTDGNVQSIRFGNVSGVQTHVRVNISGSYIENGVLVTNESSVERPNAFDVTLVNCTGTAVVTVNNTTNIYQPKVFGNQSDDLAL